MLNKYMYFLTIAEELNISKAAQRLFISHQGLSLYLKHLEGHYGVTLLQRHPKMTLTDAGIRLVEFYRQVEFMDKNLVAQFKDMKNEVHGTVNLGMVEGRYRMLIPTILKEYSVLYPFVKLNVFNDDSWNLKRKLLNNELDIFVSTGVNNVRRNEKTKREIITEEDVYIVITDNLLREVFAERAESMKQEFEDNGLDLKLLADIPFVLPEKTFTSRIMLEEYLQIHDIKLNVIMESMHPDINNILAGTDYAATICLTMYRKGIRDRNSLLKPGESQLNTYKIKGMQRRSYVHLNYLNGAIFPKYVRDLIELIKGTCHRQM